MLFGLRPRVSKGREAVAEQSLCGAHSEDSQGQERSGLRHRSLAFERRQTCAAWLRYNLRRLTMRYTLRFIQLFTLGAWVGSIFYFTAITPGLFRVIPNQDQTGVVVEFALTRLHTLGVVGGLLFMLATALLATTSSGTAMRLFWPAFGVTLMIVLTIVSQHFVIGRLAELRKDMGSVVATTATSPLREEFDRLHGVSVDLEGAVLLIGFASLFASVALEP